LPEHLLPGCPLGDGFGDVVAVRASSRTAVVYAAVWSRPGTTLGW